MQYFYHQDGGEKTVFLPDEETRHLTKVLRKRTGDEVIVLNGRGRCDRYTLISLDRKAKLEWTSCMEESAEPPVRIELMVGPTKKPDRMEWMVEKLVEIGVHRITFLSTDHGERPYLKTDRLMKKAVSALKQSGNLWLPELTSEGDFTTFIEQCSSDFKGVAHCADSEKNQLGNSLLSNLKSATILIGPEGDFSEREINHAIQSGFVPISLGNSRLRTETAALVACTLMNHFCVTLKTNHA